MKKIILFAFSLCLSVVIYAQVSKTASHPSGGLISISITGEHVPVFYPNFQSQSLKSAAIVSESQGQSSIQTTIVKNVTAGTLSSALTAEELATVTSLTLSGVIDARDFKTMRDNMPLLAELDLSGVTVASYTGTGGTSDWGQINYAANTIPEFAFLNVNWLGKISLSSFIFPSSVTSIGRYAFSRCTGLSIITLPTLVTSVGDGAFQFFSGSIDVDANNPNYSSLDGVLFNKDKTQVLQCPISKTGTYTIPSSVTSIGSFSFSYCNSLTSVVIPSSVHSIGSFAFDHCSLTSITIPSSVSLIENSAFVGSTGDKLVNENNPNYSSLDGVLYNKTKTLLIHCPASKTGIFTIPNTVTSTDSNSFWDCSGLTAITIPASVTSIGIQSFWNCSGLSSITLPSSVTSIGNNSFCLCTGLSTFVFPPLVTSIGDYTFQNCSGLKSITIPSSITSIGSSAFTGCTGLSSIYAKPVIPINLSSSSNVFDRVNKTTCILNVPWGSKLAYQSASQWGDFNNIVEANEGVLLSSNTANIAAAAGSTITVDLTSNVAWTASSSVDDYWLSVSPTSGSGNQTLTFTVEANTSVKTRKAIVSVSATNSDSQIITISQAGSNAPLALTAGGLSTALTAEERAGVSRLTLTGTIDARDFKTMRDEMPLLEEIDLSGVTVLAYTGTEGTAGIQYGHFNYPENAVPFIAFMNSGGQGKVNLKKIILPESITSISDQAFNYCSGLNSVNFPNGLVAIGHHAFAYCSGLTTVNIPGSVAAIGEGAFSMTKCSFNVYSENPNYSSSEGLLYNKTQSILIQCPGLQTGDYVIPASVISIGFDAFAGCNKLTSITIPSSVKSIGQGAFMFCSGISSIHIPSSVTFIGSQSFFYCSGLKSIYVNPASPVDLNSSYNVFEGIDKTTCILHVPYGTKAAYTVANQWQDFITIVEEPNGFSLSVSTANIAAVEGSNATIGITANVTWTASSNQNWLTVSPTSGTGSGQILTLMAQANPLFSTRTATVTVSATDIAPQTITVTQAAMAATAVVKKTTVAPVVDGAIDAVWTDANVYTIDKPFTGEAPTLGTSGQTTWKALWSNEGIYILIQVTDDNFMPAYKGAVPNQNWMYDKPEIYFDVNALKKDGFGPAAGVGHHIFSPDFTEAKIDGTPTTQPDGIVYSLKVSSPDYVGEYFIPFSKLIDKNGNDVVKNGAIGFDITVIDNDLFGPNRNRAVWANDGSISGESYSNMDACGTITLEGAEAEILISSIALSGGTISTDNGTLQMVPTILPVDATNHNLNWSVENNTGKAVINSSGLLTALKNGSVTVKAGARDGSGIEATATLTITGQLIQMDDISLIKNGHFVPDGGLPVSWSFYSPNGPVPSVVNGVTVCNPIASADAWNYQFYQQGLNALPNTGYTLSFKAWASVNRTIGVDFDDPGNNYNLYGASTDPEASGGRSWWNLNITTMPATYTLHVVFDQMNPATIQRLIFNLASTSDIVYIDDVSLVSDAELNGLKLSTSAIFLAAAEGSSSTLELTSDVSWNASSDQTWLTVSPISGAGNQTLTFTAQGNTSVAPRFAEVTVSASGFPGSQTVKITQQGANAPVNLTAGGLKTTFSAQELASITKLTLTGTIDARDFKTMRDDMPLLAEIDLNGATIMAYTGTEGTNSSGSITYPVNAVPENAFSTNNQNGSWVGKTSLTSILLPQSLTSFGSSSFLGCNGLTSLVIPNTVISIGHGTFNGCTGIASIDIPSQVSNIYLQAFENGISFINVATNNLNYSSIDGVLFNKTQTSLIYCPHSKVGSYVVPSSVITIFDHAFISCASLSSIILPDGITVIGSHAFNACTGLTSFSIPSSINSINSYAFASNNAIVSFTVKKPIPVDLTSSYGVFEGINKSTCILHVPYGAKNAYQSANQWQDFVNIVEEANGFNLSAVTVNIGVEAGSTTTVEITANVAWSASSDQTWLTVSPTSGTGNQTLTFTVEANPSTTAPRVAIVTVSAPDVPSQTITVTQQLTIDPTKLDAFEPDNTIAEASTITSGVIQQHSIYPVGDVDCASFELTNAPAEVNIRFITASGSRQIQVIATDGTTVLTQDYEQSYLTLTQNGKYYIRAWNSDNQLTESYQLSLNIKPIVVDKYEPDNTWEQATAIMPFFEQDDHTIKANGDVDYVKFTISDAPRTVYVDVTDTRRNCNQFGVWLLDNNGTTELNYASGGANYCGTHVEQTINTNGTYYVKVAVPQGWGGTRENYTIKLTTNGLAPVVKCNPTDSLSLVAVFDAMNGNNWNRKQGWKTDRVQNWQGVTMNAEGRVTKLNLTANYLRGTIPTQIGNLTALRFLNLGNNRYVESWNYSNNSNGSILPATLSNLVNLEVLSLDGLNFYTELPDVFSTMVNLRELYLNDNYFTNAQLPAGILSCSKLEWLEIQYNNFSQLSNVTGLTNLQSFQAYYNRFTFEDLEPNTSISGFNYSPQRKVGQSLALNPAAGSLVTQTIEVGGTNNQYQWYKNDLPIAGQTSNTLRIENVSASDAGIYHLRVTNTVATQLILYSEPITLYQNQLPIYKALEAFYNSTGGPNWNNKTNWLTDAPLTTWYGISQSESGQYNLSIFDNNLVGQLPDNMDDMNIFTDIHIRYNHGLTGVIPQSIGNISILRNLYLNNNSLTGEIPSTIGNLKNLYGLDLENNQLSGSVPEEIATCTNLRDIFLYNNNFDNLPDLSVMTNLYGLYLQNNRFEFDDLASTRTGKPNLNFQYNPQKKFGQVETYNKQAGEALTLTATCGGTGNKYQWYKDGNLIIGKIFNTLVFQALAISDRGSYVCIVTNPSVPNLTLESEPMSIIDPTLLDAFEPDNTIAQASTITSGVVQQHSIYPVGDVDYASFELTNAPADIEIKFNTTLAGRQLQLLAADGTTVLYSTSSQVYIALNQNGKYYIKAYNSNNQLIDSYQLSLNIKPIVVDKYEPDNTWEQGTAILPFYEQDNHTIKANGDVDYVKFTVSDAPRTVYVDVFDSRKDCYNFGVWLYDTNGTTELKYSNSGANNCGARLEQILTTNGTYFLKVAVPQGNSGTRNNYTIKLTTNGAAPVVNCNPTDSLALVAVYDNLNGNNWNRKQGWKTDRVQNWQGVTMNAEGRVTKLNLTANNLRGNIPTEIGNLIALRWLNLGNNRYRDSYNSQNDLNGKTIPQSIANLVNLEVLSLDQLYFYTELPDVFSGMVNLRELYLNDNYFTNTQLPVGILSCSKLERFEIQFNNFSQLSNVTGLTNLQSFHAYYNRFTFEDLEPNTSISGFNYSPQRKVGQSLALDPASGSLVTQTIEVGGTNNQYQWYKNDLPIAGQTTNALRIENVSASDAGIYQLRVTNTVAAKLTLYSEPIILYQNQLPIYKALEAFYNSTGGPNWNNKTNWLTDAPLTTWYGISQSESGPYALSISNNNLVGQLPVSMGDLQLFTYIYIQSNPQLTGSIPESIGNLTQLRYLYLNSNNLNGVIPSTIGNLKNLNNLNLENNQLSGSVPSTIATCTNLRYIYLYNNTLENLPDLSAMSNLYGLYIYNNRFEFDDLAPTRTGKPNLNFQYNPQKKFGQVELYTKQAGEALTLTATVGGTGNLYQWYKDGTLLDGKTSNTLVFDVLAISDPGSYVCKVTNPLVPNLILESETKSVLIGVKTIHVIGGAITSNNGTLQMMATILPEDATNKNLLWTVENSSGRATISAGGLITAILDGTVTVRAKATDGSEVEGSAQVVISGQVAELEDFNLIKNGDFVPDGNLPVPWEFWSGNGGVATFVVDGVSVSTPVQDNINTWNYGLSQSNLQALPNVDYVLTFTAWASAERKISVTFQDPNNNWLRYGTTTDPEGEWANLCQWGVNLTLIPKVFTLHVNFDNMLANTIQQISFLLAHTSDVVYIDKVTLVSATDLLLLGRPVAHAGADQSVNEGTEVTLNGSTSSDPDGSQLTYKWTAPVGITLSSTTTAKPTFTTPDVLVNTNYTFSLVVNDGTADSPADQVVITVNALQDVISPVIVAMIPMNQSIVPKNLSQLVVVFSEGIKTGTGCVKLYNQSDVLVETICGGNWVISGNTLTIPIKPLLANTTYYILIDSNAILDLAGNLFSGISNKNQFTFKTEAESVITHFTPVWTGNGFDHMNINIFSAKLDGVELEAGDEIGIFDGSICVGMGTLTGIITQTSTLDIAVSRNDGSGNGYTSGNAITFKLFDKSENLEMTNVTAIYSNTDPSWSTDGKFTIGATAFAELSGLTKVNQDITLNTGWNIISSNLVPSNPDLKSIFQPLIDAGSLKKVMDETGKTIENFGAFGGWKNNIGNLNAAKGYKVNVTVTSTLSLEGTPVSLPFDLALAAGWNIISYPSATAQDAKALVQSLIDAGKLKKVMDETGKTIENFGAFGGWKNNIGNFLSGKGYKVNVTENCTVNIPANGTKAVTIVPEVLASTHFTKAFTGNGTDHMNMNLVNLQTSGLQAGDEIGIYDGKLCVGSQMIGAEDMLSGMISIPASANDEMGESLNGFTSGHPVALKLFRYNREYTLKTVTLQNSRGNFAKGESMFAQVVINQTTGVPVLENQVSVNCYPNPFSDQLTIEIQLPEAKNLEVAIYDINGKLVRNLYKGPAEEAEKLYWDGRSGRGVRMVPGTYILKVNEWVEKIILKE